MILFLLAFHSSVSSGLYSLNNILWSYLVTCITICEFLQFFNGTIIFLSPKIASRGIKSIPNSVLNLLVSATKLDSLFLDTAWEPNEFMNEAASPSVLVLE